MRALRWVLLAGLAVPLPVSASQGAASEPDAGAARRAFADLVGASLAPPEVSPELRGTREEAGLRVEDVSWESLDGEVVPAFVVRPAGPTEPLPAIVCLHGSSGSRDSLVTPGFGPGPWTGPGRDEPHTRMLGWARELARRGFLTLSITQRGLDRRSPPINQQANVMLARGRTAMGALLHEIRQGVTYLASRDDVDQKRIGATGMSFGGITAFYAWVLDDRIAAAAPICGGVGSVDLFARTGRIGYHGTYWWVPGLVPAGDQARFAAALAPRPLMLWAPTEDVGMPKPAVDAFASAVRPAWAAAGSPGALEIHQPPGEHAFTVEAFEAMARFFSRHLVESPQRLLFSRDFELPGEAEVVAAIEARCPDCDWGVAGREGAALRVDVDGRYGRHHILARSGEPAVDRISLGRLAAGRHRVEVRLDRARTAPGVESVEVTRVSVEATPPSDPAHAVLAHSPVLHERLSAAGRFSDVPLVVWVEEDPLPDGGRRLRYSAVFSNEDGGTPADRLLATWGRLTDLEYVYGVELGPDGAVRSAEYQGKGHAIEDFDGEREGDHPLLYVITDNNMLAEAGGSRVRFAPAPLPFDLAGTSREAVMDAEPWTYRVSAQEARREGRVVEAASPGDGAIVDPRRYLYVEACAEVCDVGLTFGAVVETSGGRRVVYSDGGQGVFLVQRSADHFPNGCFRAAVALPAGAGPQDLVALRFAAHPRPPRNGEAPPAPGVASARLRRVTKLFTLGPGDRPRASLFSWEGDLLLRPGEEPLELPLPPAR